MNTEKVISAIVGAIIVIVIMATSGWVISLDHSKFDARSPSVVTISGSPGGDIFAFMKEYTQDRVEGKKIRVEGMCASACTYFLGLLPASDYCATDYAFFGFHGVYNVFGLFNKDMTQWVSPLVYPKHILDILKADGFDLTTDVDHVKYPTGLIWHTGKELNIQPCTAN